MGVEGVSEKSRAGCVWDGVRVKPGKGERAGERQPGVGGTAWSFPPAAIIHIFIMNIRIMVARGMGIRGNGPTA